MLRDLLQVDIARGIAIRAHEGQIRKMGDDKGKPYFIHPERVAKRLYYGHCDDYMIAAGYLHDIIEDTEITAEDLLKEGIDPRTVDLVTALTKTKNESYLNFILRIKNSPEAIMIKIADIEDNLRSLQEGSLKEKYKMALYILQHKCE